MPDRQCFGCKNQAAWGCEAVKYRSAPDDPRAFPDADGSYWGWIKPGHLPTTLDGEETYACPRQDLRQRPRVWHQMLTYYGMFKNGHLPQPGAVMDQSNKAIELFRILDDVNAECDRIELEEAKRRQNQEPQAGRPRRR